MLSVKIRSGAPKLVLEYLFMPVALGLSEMTMPAQPTGLNPLVVSRNPDVIQVVGSAQSLANRLTILMPVRCSFPLSL